MDERRSVWPTVVRTVGELMITLGVVMLLFVVYALYFTNVTSGRMQAEADQDLERAWSADPSVAGDEDEDVGETGVAHGDPFARIYIPAFGADYGFTIQEGVHREALDVGPGRYEHTALPGEPGNFGVAGHRVGKGAPFGDLDRLESCDAIVIETRESFFIYRVLPMAGEIGAWEQRRQADPDCAQVPTLRTDDADGGPYRETVGRTIVTPDRGDAVAPVPYLPDDPLPRTEQAALVTLTTCHPRFSARERMIIHAVLQNEVAKTDAGTYRQLLEQMGHA